jgi:hypothetical protein
MSPGKISTREKSNQQTTAIPVMNRSNDPHRSLQPSIPAAFWSSEGIFRFSTGESGAAKDPR